ncbi:MAG: hypothetical protein K6F94_03295 [Bacteroidaceae bacterium]|nr:hypothetical protein [Bacteroidaceae bacterium]
MSAIHTLYKQLSHIWLTITLMCTALFGMGSLVQASNEVMVSLSAIYDIMPPEASVYKETPEKYFVVNINNPQDHTLTIYLTMKLEKLTGEKFIMEQKVSAKPTSPMFAITLPASTSITLTSTQLHNHFRHLGLGHFNITGSLLGNVMSSNFGLLPEGDYMATLTAYEYNASEQIVEKTKEAISDPKLSTTQFKICYSVKAPELQVPLGVVQPVDPEAEEEPAPTFAGVDYKIPDINFKSPTTWNWLHLMEVCGQLPSMNYELEFFSMKNGSKGYATSPENAIAEFNDRVLLYPGVLGAPLRNVQSAPITIPNPESYFQDGEYYAVRVHATPEGGVGATKNAKLANFRMYENDGYSRPIVVRAVYGSPIPVVPEEQEKPKESGWKATVTHPKLTFPDNEGNCFGAVYIEANKDYDATWNKPEFVDGDQKFVETLTYTYNINIYKAPADAASFEDIIKEDNKPLYTATNLEFKEDDELKHTVPWEKLSKDEDNNITLGGHYFIEVTANPLPTPGEGQLVFCGRGQNCCTYTMFLTEDIVYEDCGAIEDYKDKDVVSHGETITKKQAEMNGFHVVFTELKATDKDNTTYSGTGYVKWQPLNMGTYIAMTFTGIRLNKNMQVVAGKASARKMSNADVIPYDLIDYAAAKAGNWVQNTEAYKAISSAASKVGEAVQQAAQWVDGTTGAGAEQKLNEAQQAAQNKVQQLYDAHITKWRDPDEVAKACGDYWTKYVMPGRNLGNTALNWINSGSYDEVDTDASPTFLPLGLPQSFLPDSLDMDFQVMQFDLTPTRASVGVAAFFYMPDAVRIDKAGEEVKDGTRLSTVLAFAAPRLCVKPTEIWAKEGEFGLLYDFAIKDMSTGYTFTFLAPTDYTKLNDGCAIHWEQVKGETKVNMMVLDAKMTIPGLLNEDRSRMAELRIGARIDNWSDWMAWLQMDAFQVEDLEGYVFNVTGTNGIRLDHSRVKNPDLKDEKGSPVTISSIFKDVRRGDNSGLKGYNWAHPKLGFQGVPDGKDPMNWMGLYIDEVSMTFPKGLNITDKSDPESKSLKLGLRNLLWDNSGVSLTAFVGSKQNPVVKLETGRLGGWALSLDEVAINVLQSNFSDCHFNGMFEVPLLKGTFDYECKMNYVSQEELGKLYEQHNAKDYKTDEKKLHLTFNTQQRDDMSLDFWVGDVHLDKNGSWFNIDYLDGDTQVEFMASGTVTVGEANENKTGGKVGDLPFDIPGIRFAGLRMANFKYDTKRDFAEQYAEKLASTTYKDNKKFDKNLFQAGLTKELSEADFEGSKEHPFFFNIGRWSLASEEKNMWGFPLGLKDVGVETDSQKKQIGLKFTGTLGLIGGENKLEANGEGEDETWNFSAAAGMTIWANYEFNGFDDLANASLSYDRFEFHRLEIDGTFGGGKVYLYGHLDWEDSDEKKGFDGQLRLELQDFFSIWVSGGIWEMKKDKYKNGYFYAKLSDITIPVGAANINSLACGFFWNRSLPANTKLDDKDKFASAMASGGVPREKSFGITLGLGMEFADKSLCSGEFNGFMAYDLKNDALSRLTLLGDMDALKGPDSEKGLVNARVKIDYEDNVAEVKTAQAQVEAGAKGAKAVERCQSFTLSATVDFKGDTKQAITQFFGEDITTTLENSLTQAAQKLQKEGMGEFSADAADEDNKGDGKTKGKDKAKDNLTVSASAKFSFEFQLRHYPDKKDTKWHVYLGEPSRKKRCEVVFIDFTMDTKIIKAWAKAYANAYLCLGNELPADENGVSGGLPALPDKLIEILEDNSSGESVETNVGSMSKLQAERAEQIKNGPSGNGIKGGIQFGAELGAEFGVEVPLGYVKAGALLGFDAILKQYGECACSDGSLLGGKNGFYAMAQIYAALWGSAGVHLDFGFWSGDFPLVDVAFGAVLKGGFPNPTWVYGKMRVKGKVLGGLISFNKAMELRMGKVCVPEVASPLDNIDIFSSYTVGEETKEAGWGKKGNGDGATLQDPYVMPSFTTNMNMDSQLRLVDENEMNSKAGLDGDTRAAQATSTKNFVFHLERNATLQAYSDGGVAQGLPKYCDMTPAQNSRTSFTVNTGSFNQKQNYMLHVRGYVKQLIDGREQDPMIRNLETHKDERKPWGQNLDLYFRTGPWSEDFSQEVMLFIPFDETGVILQDAGNPYFSIANDRQDMFNSPDKEWYVNMEENKGTANNPKWCYPDIKYDAAGNRQTSEQSKWERIGIELTTEYDGDSKYYTVGLVTPPGTTATIKKNTQYRFSLYSVDKKQMNDDLSKIKEARKKVVSGEADVVQALTLLAYDEEGKMTDLGKDMMAWYNEQTENGKQFSSLDQVDQVINSFENDKLSDLKYTSLEFQRVFTTGSCNTFAEKLASSDYIYPSQTLKFKKNTVTRRGGVVSARMKEGNNQLDASNATNPYYMLNWWNSTACVSSMPAHRFLSKMGDEKAYFKKDADLITFQFSPQWHGNHVPTPKKWGNGAFEKEVSPFFAQQWRLQNTKSAVTGKQLCQNMVDSVCTVLYADGKLAEQMPSVYLRFYWNTLETSVTKGNVNLSNGVNTIRDAKVSWEWITKSARYDYNESSMISSLRSTNRSGIDEDMTGYRKAFSYGDTKWTMKMSQLLSIFICDVHDNAKFIPLWDFYITRDTYTGSWWGHWGKGTTLSYHTNNVSRRGATDAIYWIAGETAPDGRAYPFSMSKYLASIKKLVFEIRRPTGYDANNSRFDLRPSTRFGNTVEMTQKVQLSEYKGVSLDVTNNGSPSMKEDNDVHFDDENFKQFILAKFDTNRDGKLTKAEAEKIKYIKYNGKYQGAANGSSAEIRNLHGIEAMTNLESLTMDRVTLKKASDANLCNNRKLRNVQFTWNWTDRTTSNGIKELPNLASLPDLDTLVIKHHTYGSTDVPSENFGGLPGTIDVSGLSHLKYLDLSGNTLGTVKGLNKLTRLTYLNLRGNRLTSIVDCSELSDVYIYVGQQYKYSAGTYKTLASNDNWVKLQVPITYARESTLTSSGAKVGTNAGSSDKSMSNYHVTVTKTGNLKNLIAQIPERKIITYIVQNYNSSSKRPKGETMDDFAKGFPNRDDEYIARQWLAWFTLKEDAIVKASSLNVYKQGIKTLQGLEKVMPNLTSLYCSNNNLEELDPSLFPNLSTLYCDNNRIVTLKCGEKITSLNCSNNALTTLDVSKAKNLSTLYCNNNGLEELILSNNTKLGTLECQNNRLKSLDASKCTSLKTLDCSNNADMSYVRTAGGALYVALYVPQSLEKLVARGLYSNNQGFYSLTLNLPNLKWLDMSDNANITGYITTTSSTKLEHLDLHNTRISSLKSDTRNLNYLDLSNSNFAGDGSKTFKVDMNTTYWQKLKTLDISDTKLYKVYVKSYKNSTTPTTLYVGAPNRTEGIKVELQMDNMISNRWETTWKNKPKNKYVYAHVGNGTTWSSLYSAEMTMENQTRDDKTMQRNLGPTLYERLKKEYAPNERWLHVRTVARQVKELDCSGLDITDIDSIVMWMPNLERLDCSHNHITKATFKKLNNLRELKINRNENLTSLTMPENNVYTYDTIDVSYTKLAKYVVTTLMSKSKAVRANGVEALSGTMYVYNNYPLTYLEVQHTNIECVDIYSPIIEKLVAGYNPKLNLVKYRNGAANLSAVCGGVNSDVEVQLSNQSMAKKWFDNSAKNPLNNRVMPTYFLTFVDGKTKWVPVVSAESATSLYNYCKNKYSSRLAVKGREITLTMNATELNNWYANGYDRVNDNVNIETMVNVGGTIKYCPVTSLQGAKAIAAMASTFTSSNQLTISKNKITVICNKADELKKWFDSCHEFFPDADVRLRVTLKDRKTTTVPVTQDNYKARTAMLEFCKNINVDQLFVTTADDIYLFLLSDERNMWYGKKQNGYGLNQRTLTNYSTGNSDVKVYDYSRRRAAIAGLQANAI